MVLDKRILNFFFEIKLKLHLSLMHRARRGMDSLLSSQGWYRKMKPLELHEAEQSFWQLKVTAFGIFFPNVISSCLVISS